MSNNPFDFQTRVLMCSVCNAPIQSDLAGGAATCSFCGSVNQILLRRDDPIEPLDAAKPIDEQQRLQILRQQSTSDKPVPASIESLLENGKIAAWKAEEAVVIWKNTFRQLQTTNDFEQAELLLVLSFLLGRHFRTEGNTLKERSLYENALEVLTLPRHRQLMRCRMARYGALERATDSAENWLKVCNPTSQDLEADSAYRVARATIDTMTGNWNGVLHVLGKNPSSVPFTDRLGFHATVLRANAIERLGNTLEAALQLANCRRQTGNRNSNPLKSFFTFYNGSNLTMCPNSRDIDRDLWDSYSMLQQEITFRSGTMPIGFGAVFLVLGLAFLAALLSFWFITGLFLIVALILGIIFTLMGVTFMRSRILETRAKTSLNNHELEQYGKKQATP